MIPLHEVQLLLVKFSSDASIVEDDAYKKIREYIDSALMLPIVRVNLLSCSKYELLNYMFSKSEKVELYISKVLLEPSTEFCMLMNV